MKKEQAVVLAAGIGWIIFYVGSFAALGSSFPTVESTGQEIIEWFTGNKVNAQIYAWTAAFAALTLTVFGGMITALLPRPHRYVFFGGVVMWAITGMVQAWFWAGLALDPQNLEPGAAQTLFNIPQYWGPIINGSTMTMSVAFIPLGFGAARSIPTWLAWLSVLLFVEQGIETITVFGESGFLAPGGTMNIYLGGVFGMAWVIGVIVWGYQSWRSPAAALTETSVPA